MADGSVLNDDVRLRSALESISAELEMPETQERTVNVNIAAAVPVVLGALPGIRELRSRAAELPEYDIENFDKVETYALALFQAHAVALAAAAPPTDFPALVEQGLQRRRELQDDIRPLSNRGLLDMNRLNRLAGGPGYRELALDLAVIAEVLRQAWPNIRDNTPITEADVDEVEQLSQALLMGIARREGTVPQVNEAQRTERRVFALLDRAYRQVERAVDFLCWDQDPDAIVPSMYAGRRTSTRRGSATETQDASAATAGAGAAGASDTSVAAGTSAPDGGE